MSPSEVPSQRFELVALDGANPLGFLAALGTLVTLQSTGDTQARLFWLQRGRWLAVIEGTSALSEDALCDVIARGLHGRDVAEDAESTRAGAQKAADKAKSAIEKKSKEIRARRLSREERRIAEQAELQPLKEEYERRRAEWLTALAAAVPSPELRLGKRIDCTESEYRSFAAGILDEAEPMSREAADMLAAFGSDAAKARNSDAIDPTPFCFITGSGHQYFLDTVRKLVDRVSPAGIREALFVPWTYHDEGLSMRWDPLEDKRYALLDSDPGPEGARTVWMANLLAYRALALFPCAPGRRGLAATAWTPLEDGRAFTWPIWTAPASVDVIRSFLQLDDLIARRPDRTLLRSRGVAAVYRARRIKVPPTGSQYKLNFTPATAM